MLTITIDSILLLFAATALSQMMQYSEKHKYNEVRKRHLMMFGLSYVAYIIIDIFVYLSYGKLICYILFGIERMAIAMFISHLVYECEPILNLPKEVLNRFVSFLCYSVAFLYIIDTLLCGGELKKASYGFYIIIDNPFYQLLYLIIYAIYVVSFIAFVMFRASNASKKRERFEVFLLGMTLGCCGIGLLAELLMSILKTEHFAVSNITNLFAVILLYELSKYHSSIQLLEEDFENDIAPNRTDIVFVINDELKVVFQDKRAEVMGQLLGDTYIGRPIYEIFSFSESNLNEIKTSKEKMPFGSSAEYSFAEKKVSMVFEHRFDRFGEMFASTVFVYNMEPKENMFNTKTTEMTKFSADHNRIIEQAIQITKGLRILLVDENLSFLNELKDTLEPFEVKVTKAIGGSDAIERILNGEFDLLIIGDGMETMSSLELCMRIRAFKGEYYANVPIIFATEKDMNEIYTEVLESGFTDYIYKPIDVRTLSEVVTRWSWKHATKI